MGAKTNADVGGRNNDVTGRFREAADCI